MRFVKALTALVFGLMTVAAIAAPNFTQGVDYRKLDRPQNTDTGKKIEVVEFFWYACPHCYAFDPSLTEWVKKQGDKIAFKRVPVMFRETFVPQQKLYYTLETMGKIEDMHKKIFDAIHVSRKRLDTDAAVAEFVEANGIDKVKFNDIYNSFGVQTKAVRAAQSQESYRIDSVPMIVIDGRYVTSPSMAGANPAMRGKSEAALNVAALDVMSFLVTQAAKERAGK
jgi:thiol:disulfide interchange protein DsbA